MRLGLIIILFTITYFNGFGESRRDSNDHLKNYIYVELLGDGDLYSINLDNEIFSNDWLEVSCAIGFCYDFIIKNHYEFYGPKEVFNIKMHYKLNENHTLGLDVGFSYSILRYSYSQLEEGVLSPGISYKYSFNNQKYYLKAKVNPMIDVIVDEKVFSSTTTNPIYIGLGFGIAI